MSTTKYLPQILTHRLKRYFTMAYETLSLKKSSKAVLVLGSSQIGKSTVLSMLAQKDIRQKPEPYRQELNLIETVSLLKANSFQKFERMPVKFTIADTDYFQFPSFDYDDSKQYRIAILYFIQKVMQLYDSFKILIVIDHDYFNRGGKQKWAKIINYLSYIFKEIQNIQYGITFLINCNINKIQISTFLQALQQMIKPQINSNFRTKFNDKARKFLFQIMENKQFITIEDFDRRFDTNKSKQNKQQILSAIEHLLPLEFAFIQLNKILLGQVYQSFNKFLQHSLSIQNIQHFGDILAQKIFLQLNKQSRFPYVQNDKDITDKHSYIQKTIKQMEDQKQTNVIVTKLQEILKIKLKEIKSCAQICEFFSEIILNQNIQYNHFKFKIKIAILRAMKKIHEILTQQVNQKEKKNNENIRINQLQRSEREQFYNSKLLQLKMENSLLRQLNEQILQDNTANDKNKLQKIQKQQQQDKKIAIIVQKLQNKLKQQQFRFAKMVTQKQGLIQLQKAKINKIEKQKKQLIQQNELKNQKIKNMYKENANQVIKKQIQSLQFKLQRTARIIQDKQKQNKLLTNQLIMLKQDKNIYQNNLQNEKKDKQIIQLKDKVKEVNILKEKINQKDKIIVQLNENIKYLKNKQKQINQKDKTINQYNQTIRQLKNKQKLINQKDKTIAQLNEYNKILEKRNIQLGNQVKKINQQFELLKEKQKKYVILIKQYQVRVQELQSTINLKKKESQNSTNNSFQAPLSFKSSYQYSYQKQSEQESPKKQKKYPGLECTHFLNGGQCINCIKGYKKQGTSNNLNSYGNLGNYFIYGGAKQAPKKTNSKPSVPFTMNTRNTRRS